MKKSIKNMITRYLSLLLILITAFSCTNDIFDQSAGNRITPAEHYKSLTDLERSMGGAVAPLYDVLPNLILIDGLRSDLMDVTDNANGDFKNIYNQSLISGNSLFDVSGLYKVIINVNEILANAGKISALDPNYNVDFQKQSNSALIGLRSWAYYELILLNNKVSYIPDNLAELPTAPIIVNKEAMIDTLIHQLIPTIHRNTAITELYFSDYPNNKALLGELYLEKEQYDSAAFYLKWAMEVQGLDKQYKVSAYNKDTWKNIFVGGEASSDENIGVMPYNGSEDQRNPLADLMLPTHQYWVKPSAVIFNLYKKQLTAKKLEGDFFRGIGVTVDTINNINEQYIKKYTLLDGIDMYSGDIIYMRCADIHMKLAEALNRMGNYSMAMILINQGVKSEKAATRPAEYVKWATNMGIRGRAYLASREIPADVTDPHQIMELVEDYIIEEREMDLAFEGSRMFDLIRIAERRGDVDYLANRVAAKYPVEKQEEVKNILRNKANWYVPVAK